MAGSTTLDAFSHQEEFSRAYSGPHRWLSVPARQGRRLQVYVRPDRWLQEYAPCSLGFQGFSPPDQWLQGSWSLGFQGLSSRGRWLPEYTRQDRRFQDHARPDR
jgi:hypothetical protein